VAIESTGSSGQFFREGQDAANIPIGMARGDREIATFDVPLRGKSGAECFEKWIYVCGRRSSEPPERRDLGLLRVRHKRSRRSRSTEHRDEFASPHRLALRFRTTPYHLRFKKSGVVRHQKLRTDVAFGSKTDSGGTDAFGCKADIVGPSSKRTEAMIITL
jgi:hypothetical protein